MIENYNWLDINLFLIVD
uniref:Uncharacterized protein n=1 Tax=Rhizophora mucronata TaxID=61149 RepID=A0A2P2QP40_RHIMU